MYIDITILSLHPMENSFTKLSTGLMCSFSLIESEIAFISKVSSMCLCSPLCTVRLFQTLLSEWFFQVPCYICIKPSMVKKMYGIYLHQKHLSLFTWNSNLTGCHVFNLAFPPLCPTNAAWALVIPSTSVLKT